MTEITLPSKFESFEHAMQVLNYELPGMPADIHGGEYGLQRVFDLLNDLGNPQNDYPSIHLAGTSGKGTTAYMIESLLSQKSLKTGMAVSPYVYSTLERWQINGEMLAPEVVLEAANSLLGALKTALSQGRLISRFEAIIALTFIVMSNQKVDVLVLETGMGGLLDPTNTITRDDKISVLTAIGLDHTHILGNDVITIAKHKAGIILPGSSVFAADQPDVRSAIEAVAAEKQAKIQFVQAIDGKDLEGQQPKSPRFAINAAIARAAANEFLQRQKLSTYSIEAAIKQSKDLSIPGRNEIHNRRGKNYIFDGAHNVQKLTALTDYWEQHSKKDDTAIVLVVAKEQQLAEILKVVSRISNRLLIVDYPEEIKHFKQAADPDSVLKAAVASGFDATICTYDEAAQLAKQSSILNWLVTGSFYHLGEMKSLLLSE